MLTLGKSTDVLTGLQMQDKVDYLSEERRLDYLEWKAGIMARIEEMERAQAMVTVPG